MGEPRIIDIELDDRTIIWRSQDIEQEKKIAIFDLLEGNHFAPAGHEGPFRILLRVEDNRLAIDLKDEEDRPLDTVRLGLARFRRLIRDYFAICDSYYKAVRSDTPHRIESIDMARRGIHNGAPAVHADLRASHPGVSFGKRSHPFGLSLSKAAPSFSCGREGVGFDKLSPNGVCAQ
jgi:uncharacterized protein (UPF0262 family)